ncbi:MAG TPA: phosphatase PAP2 family protein [Longimicrobiales bacterium]|nr:phosphatase PAP2 family protein [Longimicrobiales bacterium]
MSSSASSRSRIINLWAGIALGLTTFTGCAEPGNAPLAPALDHAAKVTSTAVAGWQGEARTQVAAHNLSPLAAGRVFAALAVAQYAAIDRVEPAHADGTLPGLGYGPGGRKRFEAERGAVAGASWTVLQFFFPNAIAALDQRLAGDEQVAGGEHFTRGVDAGKEVGGELVQRTVNDGFTKPWTGTVPVGPGLWVANGPPAGATLGDVTPYFMTSGGQFLPPAPPVFNTPEFITARDEIRTLSETRTAQQLAIAQFWNFPTGTYTPVGYWNELASSYITENRLDERAAAHVFALTHAAAFDALIGCWHAKYTYWFLRPSQADPMITLPIGLPNHPSYPSGHSCNSAAATGVLAHFFPAHEQELDQALAEAGVSRMYAGIHYRFDILAGQNLGAAVARLAIDTDRNAGLLSVIQ